MIAPLLQIILSVLIVGVLVWGMDNIPAIDATFKQIARVILIVVLVIFVLITLFGWLGTEFPALGVWRK